MSVRIQLFHDEAAPYTNLDVVSGRVILILPADATISAINVKLEGESKTRLAGARHPGSEQRSDKQRTELELHKLLYKVEQVFPDPSLKKQPTSGSSYTLLAGQYEYPFRFKLPFNNTCSEHVNSPLKDLKVGALNVQFAPDTNRHVKKALPPSLTGFPGEAEVKYYIKATVVRPKFYQENIRQQIPLKFLPIEPPRPPYTPQEKFARRKQQFTRTISQPNRRGLFRKSSVPDPTEQEEPPNLQIDSRLPNPPILTCNEPLPLRILVQRLNESSATILLSMLQIELISYTHIRAHDLNRTESSSWLLTSQSNMNVPLGNPVEADHKGLNKEWEVPDHLWSHIPLPNTVAPSFDTCNISRTYELEVRVGLAHGGTGPVRPELMVLPLRIPLRVYSGIKPPPELLRAHAAGRRQSAAIPGQPHLSTQIPQSPQSPTVPQTPATPSYGQTPPQVGSISGPQPIDGDEAPPSYEDAMADDLAPVDGPRRDYNIPDTPERQDSGSTLGGEKGPGIARHPSERLFPQNNIGNHSRGSSFGQTSEDAGIQNRMTGLAIDEDDELGPPLPTRRDTRNGDASACAENSSPKASR